MKTIRNYDTKCHDLAEAFLEYEPLLNNERHRHLLATLIQQTIEDFIEYERGNAEPPSPPGFEAGFAENH
jgi:hypothetical protein